MLHQTSCKEIAEISQKTLLYVEYNLGGFCLFGRFSFRIRKNRKELLIWLSEEL